MPAAQKLAIAFTCLALVFAAPALAASAHDSAPGSRDARGDSTAALSIQRWNGGLIGELDAPDPSECAAGRPITIYAADGSRRDPGEDREVTQVDALRGGGSGTYVWTAETGVSGTVYAEAAPRPGCAEVHSAPISVTSSANDAPVPGCPRGDLRTFCRIDLHYNLRSCPNFTDYSSGRTCTGTASGTIPWERSSYNPPFLYAGFAWFGSGQGQARRVQASSFVGSRAVALIEGNLAGPGRAELEVTSASASEYNFGALWITPPQSTRAPGTMGGPLYLDFSGGSVGATVSIRGYLFRTR
jgi:hypothetical protein